MTENTVKALPSGPVNLEIAGAIEPAKINPDTPLPKNVRLLSLDTVLSSYRRAVTYDDAAREAGLNPVAQAKASELLTEALDFSQRYHRAAVLSNSPEAGEIEHVVNDLEARLGLLSA